MDNKEVNGSTFIPASQRPDGTWRKPRRVKEGYVPQEEVPLYESKGKQFLNRKSQLPPGMSFDVRPHRTIPGLFIEDEKEKTKKDKKKQKTVNLDEITKKLSQTKVNEASAHQQDSVKRLKNLRKRLREIETLEQKIKSGEIKKPEKEQLEKVSRKVDVLKEIKLLETSANK